MIIMCIGIRIYNNSFKILYVYIPTYALFIYQGTFLICYFIVRRYRGRDKSSVCTRYERYNIILYPCT